MSLGNWRAIVARGFCWTAVLVAAGCGGSAKPPGPQPYPVHGKVVYQGTAAAGFRVSFIPLATWEGAKFAPSAATNDNGEFQLRSFQPNDGAPAGDYVVTFFWPQDIVREGDPGDAPTQIDRLKGRYGDPKKSPFKVTVHEGENTLEPFVLN